MVLLLLLTLLFVEVRGTGAAAVDAASGRVCQSCHQEAGKPHKGELHGGESVQFRSL